MKRRPLIASALAALSSPCELLAQIQGVARIGQLGNRPPSDAQTARSHRQFAEIMKGFGWELGRNLNFDYKWGPVDLAHQTANAKELVAAKVDIIWAGNNEATAAAFQLTRSIPIVMFGTAAVELGYARSLAHPGGNVTGMVYQVLDHVGKEFELLRAIRPDLKKIGFSESTQTAGAVAHFKKWQDLASAKGATVVLLPNLLSIADIEPMLAAARREGVEALVIGGVRYSFVGPGLQKIQAWATENRVLTYAGSWQPGQVLATFGLDGSEVIPVLSRQINRILRGAKPADIPIEQPTRFKLIINQKIARAMGLTIPQAVLLQATELIE